MVLLSYDWQLTWFWGCDYTCSCDIYHWSDNPTIPIIRHIELGTEVVGLTRHDCIYLYKCTNRVTSGYLNDTFSCILALGLHKYGYLNGRAIFLLWTKDWKWILVANWPLVPQVLAPIVLFKKIWSFRIYLPFCNVTIMTMPKKVALE